MQRVWGRHDLIGWLILVLWVEVIALLVFRAYCLEPHTSGSWWVMVSNVHLVILGVGIAYWWFRVYGVVLGLSIVAFAWCVLQG